MMNLTIALFRNWNPETDEGVGDERAWYEVAEVEEDEDLDTEGIQDED